MIPHNLTASNYFSPENQMLYMGVSQYKTFADCQLRGLAEARGLYVRPMSTALLVGSYVDAHFSGELDLFKAQHPEILKRDGSLKSEYENANDIIARIERDEEMMRYLTGQHQVIMVGEIGGVKFKIKIDCLNDDFTTDQKIMRDFKPLWKDGEKLHWIEYWGYDIQGAVYQEIRRQNLGDRKPFVIAGATKEPVTDIDLFNIPQHIMDAKLQEVEYWAPQFQAIKEGKIEPEACGVCDWCKERKVLTGPIDYTECMLE